MRAAWRDLKDDKRLEGASTISQQLARTLWLGTERGWRRKIPETMITMQLEQKLTKQQIFYYYANSIYLGNQGSFSIHGFGEGSQVYLGKDLSKITLPDAALLAGLIQSPGARNPFSHPDRALARRNIVLKQMRENDFITEQQYQEAVATPLEVNHGEVESSDAPVFRRPGERRAAKPFSGSRFLQQLQPRVHHARSGAAARRGGSSSRGHRGDRSAVEAAEQEIRHQRVSCGAGGAGGACRPRPASLWRWSAGAATASAS